MKYQSFTELINGEEARSEPLWEVNKLRFSLSNSTDYPSVRGDINDLFQVIGLEQFEKVKFGTDGILLFHDNEVIKITKNDQSGNFRCEIPPVITPRSTFFLEDTDIMLEFMPKLEHFSLEEVLEKSKQMIDLLHSNGLGSGDLETVIQFCELGLPESAKNFVNIMSLQGFSYIIDPGSLSPMSDVSGQYININPLNVPFRDTERVIEGTNKLLQWELTQVDIQSFDLNRMASQIADLCTVCPPIITFENSPSPAIKQNKMIQQRDAGLGLNGVP